MPEDRLVGLHDIVLPSPVSYAPATVGWWVVLALGLGLCAWWGVRLFVRSRADAYRRQALEELSALRSRHPDPAALAGLAPLLKRTALAMAPREAVASLAGPPWLAFLDETGPEPLFTTGPGRRLEDVAYGAPGSVALTEDEQRALFAAAEAWLRGHRRPVAPGDA